MDPLSLALLFLGTIAASFISALTGGTGLFTIPFMIFLGLAPEISLSTNKVGSLGLMSGGLLRFRGEEQLNWKLSIHCALIAAVTSNLGARLLGYFESETLRSLTGAMILILLPISFYYRSLGIESGQTSQRKKTLGYFLFGLASFIGGFFGAGIGVFTIFILMLCFGQSIIEARATSLIPHLTMAISSLFILSRDGFVYWEVGAVLALAMLLGGYLGTNYGIKKGARWVKLIFNSMITLMAAKLLLA